VTTFESVGARNDFYAEVGARVGPASEDRLHDLPTAVRPEAILERLA
jgi:hypothetical protein